MGARGISGWRKATIHCRTLSIRQRQTTDASPGGRGRKLAIKQPSQEARSWLGTDFNSPRCPDGRSVQEVIREDGEIDVASVPLGKTEIGSFRLGKDNERLSLRSSDFSQPIDAESFGQAKSVPSNIGQGFAVPSPKNPVDFT